MQLSIRQLLPDCRPYVRTQPLHAISIRRVFPGPNGHEVRPAAERLPRLNSCEEGRNTKLMVRDAVDTPQEGVLVWGADQGQIRPAFKG